MTAGEAVLLQKEAGFLEKAVPRMKAGSIVISNDMDFESRRRRQITA
ncbi:MAG: hypothetical protein P0Y64_08190 [Candidatus Sphingomonas colombiensis]|nr:hypothetical protein [Sphingomonas sp.]WEK44743.1 MAG: hypothetical protein P0Y64_08190 [Sphingomonas sp.]